MPTYATWNPADKGAACTLSNGNLTTSGIQTNGSARSTVGVSSGKWYWELSAAAGRLPIAGIAKASASLGNFPGSDAHGYSYYGLNAKKINSGTQTSYGSSWSPTSQVVGIALDMDAGTIEFYKAGVSMGVAFTGLSGTFYAMTGGDTDSAASAVTANFGASAFTYSVPTGFNPGLYDAPPPPTQTGQATGMHTTAFGTHTGTVIVEHRATGLASTAFGTPTALAHRIVQASGFSSTAFGLATGLGGLRSFAATGQHTTAFGTPNAVVDLIVQATGMCTTQFGTPVGGSVHMATGMNTTRFGTPFFTEPRAFQASGLGGTKFGKQHIAIRMRPPRSCPIP